MASDDPADTLLTTEEVAARLHVKKITVLRMIRRGDLPGYQISHSQGYRVRAGDLADFIAAHRVTPDRAPITPWEPRS